MHRFEIKVDQYTFIEKNIISLVLLEKLLLGINVMQLRGGVK
jgi:hypothetical protein